MTMTRVTHRSASATMMNGLQGNLSRMQKLQEQLSSGKLISRPSDAPVDTAQAMQLRSDVRRTEQYIRNAENGLAWLGTADSVLSSGVELVRKARDLTLQGMNDTNTADGRAALAAEIDSLRQGLIDVANTKYLDRPLFAGNAAVQGAYDPANPSTYAGDAGRVTRTVAPGTTVDVNVPGTAVFGDDGDPAQLFDLLAKISADLMSTDDTTRRAGLNADLGNLDKAIDRVVTTLGQIGARYNRVETMRNAADEQLLTLKTGLSEREDIDLPRTIVDLQMQEVAYQAALGATARVVQPSLLDFLR